METEWANSYNEADNSSPEFQLPDWGFLQRPYSETELRKEEVSSSRVCARCPLVNNAFIVSEASEERPSKKQRKKKQNVKFKFLKHIFGDGFYCSSFLNFGSNLFFGFDHFTTIKFYVLGSITVLTYIASGK